MNRTDRTSHQTSLLEAFGDATQEQMASKLDSLVQFMGERNFCHEAARQLVLFAGPEIAIPGGWDRFAPLVREGIEFFLSGISYQRLRRVLFYLFTFRNSKNPGERLLHLALNFPTLHKLGQVIARNPHLDPEVKRWLVGLEQGNYGTNSEVQIRAIRRQLDRLETPPEIDISPYIIAEASVATVLPFYSRKSGSDKSAGGVFKVLKPGIQDDLREELDVLADTFAFLEQNKKRFGLQEMSLTGLFEEIREDMAREVDLVAEQAHLAEAVKVYDEVTGIRIPKPAPFSTPTMTSMEFIDGVKIGDIELSKQQRLVLARSIFEAIMCVPLFNKEEHALFHGDPHAGNILIVPGSDQNSFEVALLDWTLAGHLSKEQRIHVMELLLGIIKNDSQTLAGVIESLSLEGEISEGKGPEHPAERIQGLLATKEYLACDSLKKSFLLLEEMTLAGVVFPSELILFRKSFFTLEGVLHDISPGFAMGETMERYLAGLLLQELPQRYTTWMIPAADKPENYQTLLSNRMLQELSLHQALTFRRKAMRWNSLLIDTQIKLMTDFFEHFSGSHYCSR
jgi:ubiquinone biosynthesis protein